MTADNSKSSTGYVNKFPAGTQHCLKVSEGPLKVQTFGISKGPSGDS